MEAEIKFRGLKFNSREWAYGYLISGGIFGGPKDDVYIFCDGLFTQVIPETVGQLTGQQDSNGKDIYGGDLISLNGKHILEIKYEYAKFICFHTQNDYGNWGNLHRLADLDFKDIRHEVIGNIHTGTELPVKQKV